MTISSEARVTTPAVGNGVTTVFPFAFKVFSTSDVVVTKTTNLGVESTLVLTTDYTVTLNANQDTSPGGNVTLNSALTTNYLLTITSAVANTQAVKITNRGGFFPSIINNALDRQTILSQQILVKANRSIKIPVSDGTALTTELPTASLRANKAIVFDADGNVDVSADDYVDQLVNVTAQATAAANSATAASTSASSASTSATNAATSATAASTSATSAASSATAAANSATAAAASATTATTQATNAATSASAASTSASAAATSATTATTQATNAANSATAAATSATNAATSETNASTSATSAAGSATTATTQATNASNSASAAATSATSASTSATNSANSATSAATSATAAATSALLAAAASGYSYTYSTTTASTDPGSGKYRLNNATISSATALYISETTGGAQGIAADIATWDDGTSSIRGRLRFIKQSDPTVFALFDVTGSNTDNGTWDTVNLAYVGGGGVFANNDVVTVFFTPKGDLGATGASGSVQIATAGGTADAITADYTPDVTLTDKMLVVVVPGADNTTTTPTFAPDGLTAHTITKRGGAALVAGDIKNLFPAFLCYNLANTRWELLNPATAALLSTARAIYGNNFDGSAALAQVIASTYGGTGNGFAKLSGPAASEKTFTLPNASAAILTDNAAVTVAQGGTGLATLTAHALQVGNGTSNVTQIGVGATGTILKGTSASDPSFTATPVLGASGTTGTLGFSGTTSGTVTIQPQSAAGTYNFNLPITAGNSGDYLTSAGGGATAMTWTTPPAATTAASQSDQETATSTTTYVAPGTQQFHPSAAKFWADVSQSGTTATLTVSYNVTSMSDLNLGQTRITIATDFSSANWCCLVSWETTSIATGPGASEPTAMNSAAKAAGTVDIAGWDNGGAAEDPEAGWQVVGYGDQ
jgi:hypothetical protein